MMEKWGKYLIILGLIVVVVASVAIYGCTNPSSTKRATDNTDTETAGPYVDPWEEMRRQSTPFNIAVITQDKTLASKLRKNKYPEVNKSAQFKLVLPEHAKAPIPADAVWVMKDQHEAALDTTTAVHTVLEQFARQGKPVVFFGFADENKLAEAFSSASRLIDNEGTPGFEIIASYIKFDRNQESATIGCTIRSANEDWDTRVKSILASTWGWRKGAGKDELPNKYILVAELTRDQTHGILKRVYFDGKGDELLWTGPSSYRIDYVAVDSKTKDIALVLSNMADRYQYTTKGDQLVLLRDGAVKKIRETKSGSQSIQWPFFLEDGSLLWLEWEWEGRDKRVVKYLSKNSSAPTDVSIDGEPKDQLYLNDMHPIGKNNVVALTFRVPGKPGVGFALVLAKFDGGKLQVYSKLYYADSSLEGSVGTIKGKEAVIYHRMGYNEEEKRVATDIVRVDFVNNNPVTRILAKDCGADPNYGHAVVNSVSEDNLAIFRSLSAARGEEGRINIIDLETGKIRPTGVVLSSYEEYFVLAD